MAATVRIGTCSWADEALSKWFYPPKLPAQERLAWYAEHFDTVEVDSTYYRLPSESMVRGWAERTPDGFTMHVKAFGLMTRHPVRAEVIPEDLRGELPIDERGRVDRPPRELRGEIFRRFLGALEPLRSAGKLGGILFSCRRTSSTRTRRSTTSSGPASSSARTRCSSSSGTARGSTTRTAQRASPSSSGSAPATSSSTRRARRRHGTSSRPSSPRRPRPPTSASTAATSAPGTGAAARRPSASTTSTPTRSSASGSSRCASLPGRPSRPTPSSTTTPRRRIRTIRSGAVSQAATNARQLRRLLDVNQIAASGGA